MAKVYLVRDVDIPPFPRTWSLYRVSDKRCEGQGFKTKDEAYAWAKKWKHDVLAECHEEK